jgi:NitT/TauT family transport system ATP-binding protein
VFQNFALFPWKTVLENVMYGLQKKGLPEAECREIAQAHIKLVHLGGFEQAYPSQLSGGMQQRAAIARTLAVDPDILLMDEWFSAGDADFMAKAQTRLEQLVKASEILVIATHDMDVVKRWCNRVIRIDAGRIVGDGVA